MIIWIFGRHSSGKTTLMNRIHDDLKKHNIISNCIDSDAIRSETHKHLGFSDLDRMNNNIGLLNKALDSNKEIEVTLVTSILPYNNIREKILELSTSPLYFLYLTDGFDDSIKYPNNKFEEPTKGYYVAKYSQSTLNSEEYNNILEAIIHKIGG